MRHELQTCKDRLKALAEEVAERRILVTEGQIQALVRKKTDNETCGTSETEHPGYRDETSTKLLIYFNDAIFSARAHETIESLGIEPEPNSLGRPRRNGIAERWVGSVRREMLDHIVVLDEVHLRRLLREYAAYYSEDRIHARLQDAPRCRAVENRGSPAAKIMGLPRNGGLHHRYTWSEAA
jgi:transposase InsO family protein